MSLSPHSPQEDLRRLGEARVFKLLANDANAEAFADWLTRALQAPKPSRTALHIWERFLLKAGLERNVTLHVHMQERLGVKDEDEARHYIELGKRLEAARNDASMTLEQYHEEALEIMDICHKQKPELRELARVRIG